MVSTIEGITKTSAIRRAGHTEDGIRLTYWTCEEHHDDMYPRGVTTLKLA